MTDWRVATPARGAQEVLELRSIIRDQAYIAGGYAGWCASRRRRPDLPGDIDLWLYREDGLPALVSILEAAGFEKKAEDEAGIRFNAPKGRPWDVIPCPVQIIRPRQERRFLTFGQPDDVVGRFDFTVCRAFLQGNVVAMDPRLVADDRARRLRIEYLTCPVSAIIRSMKYARKGYTLPLTEIFKILRAWESQEREPAAEAAITAALVDGGSWDQKRWEEWYEKDAVQLVARFD